MTRTPPVLRSRLATDGGCGFKEVQFTTKASGPEGLWPGGNTKGTKKNDV